ncbi:4Fe-4S dicluster domain-containing protein [Holophaga foetida]|uniref:4Fe-4S dicluster domain-containing protein n=1 Tax=Holophaga foetida TaxID=35839 RepID=UPI0002474282|nr:4Fe-4S dicluster domain-containing protein [Holophaga foetida]
MSQANTRPKPFLLPDYCKGCGRCVHVCVQGCISFTQEINPLTGMVPVTLDLAKCTGCGLCIEACPEPYGLKAMEAGESFELQDPATLFGARRSTAPEPVDIPGRVIPMPSSEPLVIKGTYAAALGALMAGCRHVFGYPITPSTEGAELMAKLLPKMDGFYLQAVSEVATVYHMYGCGGAGLPSLTFTSSPGLSLMLEGISYMIAAELPGVFIDIMRGGPGLGNIGPDQGDVKLACRGLGHGNTHAITLMPSTPQEMLDLTYLAFELSFKYRNPVMVMADGYLGQMTGKVKLPDHMVEPGLPAWGVYGDLNHRGNLNSSVFLDEATMETRNLKLFDKYEQMKSEARAECFQAEDAEILLVACNTPSRASKGAAQKLREQGARVGLFRPITIWPFPIEQLLPLLPRLKQIVVVEASKNQIEDELRLALSHAGITDPPPITHVQRYGGILPKENEVVAHVQNLLGRA